MLVGATPTSKTCPSRGDGRGDVKVAGLRVVAGWTPCRVRRSGTGAAAATGGVHECAEATSPRVLFLGGAALPALFEEQRRTAQKRSAAARQLDEELSAQNLVMRHQPESPGATATRDDAAPCIVRRSRGASARGACARGGGAPARGEGRSLSGGCAGGVLCPRHPPGARSVAGPGLAAR